MSVRNQYAKNYTKVSPFPPSNRLIAEAKIAARKGSSSKAAPERQARSGRREETFESAKHFTVIDKHALNNMTRRATQETRHEHFTAHPNSGMNDDNARTEDRHCTKTMQESFSASNGCEILKTFVDDAGRRDESTYVNDSSSMNNNNNQSGEDKDSKPARPKSARPESRLERHHAVNHVFETSERQQTKPIRPKSARPESRMSRMMEAHAQDEFSGKDDLPPRPRTSYGQRRGSRPESEVFITVTDRPKSRIGNYSNETTRDNVEREIQPKKRDKKSKHHHKTDRVQNYSRQRFDGDSGAYSSSPQQDFTTWRSKTVLDLNSGIDDIDLDVDPVLYFMQDDDIPAKPIVTKQSLSKDTINFIGNPGSERQGKSAFGYQDNYLDKYHSAAAKQDRYHDSRVNSVQNSILESDRYTLTHATRSKTRNDPFLREKARTPLSGGAVFTDSYPDTYNYLKLNRTREIIGECRGQHPSDVNLASDNRGQGSYRRHPRKLQPISAVFSNNT